MFLSSERSFKVGRRAALPTVTAFAALLLAAPASFASPTSTQPSAATAASSATPANTADATKTPTAKKADSATTGNANPRNLTADAANPTPSHLAAARELVIACGMTRSFKAVIPQLVKHLTSIYAQTRPDLTPDLEKTLKELAPEFQKHTDEMVDKAAHIFAKYLTEKEIKADVAFFKSEPGKRYVETQPYFFDDVVNAMQDWHERIEKKLLVRVRAELKKKGHTL